jgi:hypothetical protein
MDSTLVASCLADKLIRLDWKVQRVKSTLAYYDKEMIMAVKCFVVHALVVSVLRH